MAMSMSMLVSESEQFKILMQSLPKDCILKIISFLDIDSRRALNIYIKMKIPKTIQNNINKVLQIPDSYLYNNQLIRVATICLKGVYFIRHEFSAIKHYDGNIYNYYCEPSYFVEHNFNKSITYHAMLITYGLPHIYKSSNNEFYIKLF
jgi:hypothetical protein